MLVFSKHPPVGIMNSRHRFSSSPGFPLAPLSGRHLISINTVNGNLLVIRHHHHYHRKLRLSSGSLSSSSLSLSSSSSSSSSSMCVSSNNQSPFITNDPLPPIPLTTVPTPSPSSSSVTPGKGRAVQRTPKKPRMVFTEIQRRTLVAIFKEIKRPSKEIQATIADQLGLKMSTVVNFFMNARRRSIDKYTDDSTITAVSIADDCPGSSAVSSTGSLYDATA